MHTTSNGGFKKFWRTSPSAVAWRTLGVAATLATFVPAFAVSAAEPVAPPDEDFVPAIEVPTGSRLKSTGTPSLGPTTVVGGAWVFQGPGPSRFGQVENISPSNEVVGAVNAVAPHPTNPNILFVGGANGGVWRTLNATAASPTWTPLTDQLTSLSIGALAFDLLDPTFNTVWAGVGRFSSFGRAGGPRTGLQRTTNGGDTWTEVDGGGLLVGKNISGVVVRSNVVVISVNTSDAGGLGNSGIFRSTNFGATFTQVSSGNGALTGLPGGAAFDLSGDPSNLNVIYTALIQADTVGGINGVYRSADRGATWARVSNPAIEALISTSTTSNMRMNVSPQGVFYIGILNSGRLAGVFRTGNGGGTWQQMDIPATNENGTDVGINPNPRGDGDPGGQGSIHFSIAADPVNTNVVYVGGDRQPRTFGDTGGFPNSIGAVDFSGRLFRGDASQSPGNQWVHLTHSSALGAPGGGTLSGSSPHADSRDMAFDAAGNLIEGDDGGVYKRTSPQNNAGDWFSINGNLGVTEFHNVAYDANANVSVGGAQDTGTPRQNAAGNTPWTSVSTADGGDVAVDVISTPGFSVQYSSFQNLGSFRRRTYDVNNVATATTFPALTLTNGIGPFRKLFVTPVRVNAVNGRRLIFGSSSNLYESLDQGNNISEVVLTNGISNHALAYGGRSGGVTNADVLYAGSSTRVFVRTNAGGLMLASATYPGSTPRDIALDPDDWRTAFVIDSDQVFTTANAGGSWTEITGDLAGVLDFRAVQFIVLGGSRAIAVGTLNGVFACHLTAPTTWFKLGSALPNAPVYDLSTHTGDNVLVAGTLGRGAWKIPLGLAATNDVVLTMLDSPDPVPVGLPVTYALTVSNTGPSSATGVTVTNVLPAGVNFFSATSSQGACVNNSGTVVCTVGAMAASASVSLTIVGTTTTTGFITNRANVVRGEADGDVNNNSATATTTVVLPTLSINDVALAEGNAGTTNAVFLVTLAPAGSQTVTVAFNTTNGTATAGSDYFSTNGTLTFLAGQTTQSVIVRVSGDMDYELNETFSVNLSAPVNATLSRAVGLGTITDNDAAPTLSVAGISVVEGNTGTTNAVFELTLSAPIGLNATVNFTTANGSASNSLDFVGTNGIRTFTAGTTSATVVVPVIGETLNESNETFFLNLSGAVNATLAATQAVGTIINDDTLASLTASAFAVVADNCNTNGFVDPGETVTMNFTLRNAGSVVPTTNLVATLLTSANVLAPGAPQNYGAMSPGTTRTRPFSFTANGLCGASISATLQLQDGPNDLGTVSFVFALGPVLAGTQSFTNSTSITIPSSGAGTPYPSAITVSNVVGTVTKVTATLRNLGHTWPDDVDLLLVGPTGQKVMLLSDAGGSAAVSGVSLTFDDAAASAPDQTQILAGTYHPTDYETGDTMFAPAPAGPYGTNMSAFTNLNPNGLWQLFAVDDVGGDTGSIAGGWELNFTIGGAGACCGAALALDHFSWDAVPGTQYVGSPFPVTVRARNAADQTLSNFTGVVALSARQGSNQIFSANFESGLQGFAINNNFGRSNGLWHLSSGRGADAGHSSSNSLYYGTGEGSSGGGNYNVGANEGVVVSPSIDLSTAAGTVTLTFNYLLQTEGASNFDLALVEVSTNNGAAFQLVAGTSQPVGPITNNTGGLWRQAAINLSAFAGWPIRLRFHFDSVDEAVNGFEGWYVDDIAISSTESVVPITPVLTGNFVAGVWTGNITALRAAAAVTLKADDGLEHTGISNPFDVIEALLRLDHPGNVVVLSWTQSLAGFTLKSATNLNPVSVWTTVAPAPVIVGGRFTVTNTVSSPQRFYRLEK